MSTIDTTAEGAIQAEETQEEPQEKSRKKIIALATAGLIAVAGIAGGLTWHNHTRNAAHQEAWSSFTTARAALDGALEQARAAADGCAEAVEEASLCETLTEAISKADVPDAAKSASTNALTTATKDTKSILSTLTEATEAVTKARLAKALTAWEATVSQATEKITATDTLLTSSEGQVDDDTVRTSLASARDAVKAASETEVDQADETSLASATSTLREALTALDTATTSVNDAVAAHQQAAAAQAQAAQAAQVQAAQAAQSAPAKGAGSKATNSSRPSNKNTNTGSTRSNSSRGNSGGNSGAISSGGTGTRTWNPSDGVAHVQPKTGVYTGPGIMNCGFGDVTTYKKANGWTLQAAEADAAAKGLSCAVHGEW